MPTQSIDPRTGSAFGPALPDTSVTELDQVLVAASSAASPWATTPAARRAVALRQVAEELDAAAAGLVALADRETGLGEVRLIGELGRTTFQLRMFGALLEEDACAGAVIDTALAGPPPAGHPDLRRMLVPLGPVAVYGASNFPFAFSVPGGDTASALAAGCPVVVKAHPGHPQTSEAAAAVIRHALTHAGAPEGVFGLVRGFEAGVRLVQHPVVKAAAFTGSAGGGRALFDLAVSRPDPIPFYGELGSVNPVVVSPAAAQRGEALATAYVDSLTLGNGQFCTNPGLLLVPSGSGLAELVAATARTRPAGVMLHAGVAELFRRNVSRLSELPGVRCLVSTTGTGTRSGAVILAVDAATAAAQPELLHTECFGPAAVLVEYASEQELLDVVDLLEGCLVATVHADAGEPVAATLVQRLARVTGRLVWNDWPTGVAVTAAQHHGGPFPATTNALHTSVGTTAVNRFLRPVTFQSVPDSLLPEVLKQPSGQTSPGRRAVMQ